MCNYQCRRTEFGNLEIGNSGQEKGNVTANPSPYNFQGLNLVPGSFCSPPQHSHQRGCRLFPFESYHRQRQAQELYYVIYTIESNQMTWLQNRNRIVRPRWIYVLSAYFLDPKHIHPGDAVKRFGSPCDATSPGCTKTDSIPEHLALSRRLSRRGCTQQSRYSSS